MTPDQEKALRAELEEAEESLQRERDENARLFQERADFRTALAAAQGALREVFLEAGFLVASIEAAQASRLAIRELARAALTTSGKPGGEAREIALHRMLETATVRIEILLDRMRGCDDEVTHGVRGDTDGHALSLFEGEAWIEEQRAILLGVEIGAVARPGGEAQARAKLAGGSAATCAPCACGKLTIPNPTQGLSGFDGKVHRHDACVYVGNPAFARRAAPAPPEGHPAPGREVLGECVGHLGPPSNTGAPHPKGGTCSHWKPLAAPGAGEQRKGEES